MTRALHLHVEGAAQLHRNEHESVKQFSWDVCNNPVDEGVVHTMREARENSKALERIPAPSTSANSTSVLAVLNLEPRGTGMSCCCPCAGMGSSCTRADVGSLSNRPHLSIRLPHVSSPQTSNKR